MPRSGSSSDVTAAVLRAASDRATAYLRTLDARRVAPDPAAVDRLTEYADGPMPAGPAPPDAVLRALDELGSPATVANAGPRYFGFVTGGALPVTIAANWLATAWDQNAFAHVASPAAVVLENTALRWLLDLLGLPPDAGAAFVTGATMANFTALAAARHRVLADAGWDAEAKGLFGAPAITVVVGAEAHSTLYKALGLLGLGRERVVTVPADGQGRMRADALPAMSGPTIVCLQAGNVNTGAFDPAGEVCARARAAGAWVHVDGAFGLWAAAAPALADLAAGVADADSWATDAHKWLNVPYDSGIALVRDAAALSAAMSVAAPYLPDADRRDPFAFTPESSRRARGVEIWAVLSALGRSGLAALIEGNCALARRFADKLAAGGCEVLNEVVLNQVLVAFGDDETTARVIAAVQADGTCWCGGTTWHGRHAMRISVSSWATTEADVDLSVEAILRLARAEGMGQGN